MCGSVCLGYGGLSLSIEGPSKVDINTEDQEDGTCKVTYCPTEPGNYIINIKFADQHVPGACLYFIKCFKLVLVCVLLTPFFFFPVPQAVLSQ